MNKLKFRAVREFSYDYIIGKSGNSRCPQSPYFIIYYVTWNAIIQKPFLHVEGRNNNSQKIIRCEGKQMLKRVNALLWVDVQDDREINKQLKSDY